MAQTFPLKNIPAPVRLLIRPMLYASIGLHAFLLLVPFSSTEEKPKQQEKTVKVTQLPASVRSSAKPSPKSSPLVRQRITPVRRTQTSIPPVRRQQQEQFTSRQQQSQAEQQTQQQTLQTQQVAADPSDPLASFPHFPGSQPGCLGVQSCFATGKDLATVAAHFEKQLPAKKWEFTRDTSEGSRKVYQISKAGETQYLSAIFVDNTTGTVYVLAPEPRSLEDLQKAVQIPPEFTANILAKLAPAEVTGEGSFENPQATPDDFMDVEAFYVKPGGDSDGFDIAPEQNPEIDSTNKVTGQSPEQLYSTFFVPELEATGFDVTQVDDYGGGKVYRVQKGTGKPFFINLVPTRDGNSTIVVTWRSQPV